MLATSLCSLQRKSDTQRTTHGENHSLRSACVADHHSRPQSKANRAGTRGFRAPEVLFKCGQQSGGRSKLIHCVVRANLPICSALDMWAAGIILLFFLTGKFPLFQSNDDMEALIEIACVVGKRKMEKAATLHSQ